MSDDSPSKRKSATDSSDNRAKTDSSDFSTHGVPDPTSAAVAVFTAERDSFLGTEIHEATVPQTEEDYALRDPFSADYLEFRLQEADYKRSRVNTQLRADLLAAPHLMEKPAESGSRGAAAVWRSLRDILRGESAAVLDSSDRQELLMLQRELEARKAIVEAVNQGIGKQLKRLEQRLSAIEDAEAVAARATARSKTKKVG